MRRTILKTVTDFPEYSSGIPHSHSMLTIKVPYGTRPLTAQVQYADQINVWWECDTDAPLDQSVILHCIGTGTVLMLPDNARHIGAVQLHGYVWHIYWEPVK